MCPARFRVDHRFAIPVIRSNNHSAPDLIDRGHNPRQSLIYGFARLNRGPQITRMTNHIGVGKIGNNQIISGANCLNKCIGHFAR